MGRSQDAGPDAVGLLHESRPSDAGPARDPLYLFACYLAWHRDRDIRAYQELVAALDDRDPDVRMVAENLLHRPSPRPDPKAKKALNTDG
jgi:hypothetical protein